ncbi:related to amine oxidase [Phialocephala subalpina]|uniref:Amine oxidase n=1 Tax=Phialocephala subalpina TaxID=576137 RepID=A0A1L7XRH8_9HELO|nr:related to amine oxidase [Phialocephala subalpina]
MAASDVHSFDSVDVVVVGAGLSGLQAALDVQKAGLSCIVLEARDQVGGKTLSQPLASGKGVVDLGAAWLNEATQPRIYALAKKYRCETVVQLTKGDGILEDTSGTIWRYPLGGLPDSPAATLQAVGMITGMLETEAAKLDLRNLPTSKFDKITVAEFLQQNGVNEDAYKIIETTVKALLGVDATELSLFFYLDYIKSGRSLKDLSSEKKNGAQYQRLRQGELRSGLLLLESPVSHIHREHNSTCIVTTQKGDKFREKKVIISIPTPLYRTINFTPALPRAKITLADSTTLGYYAKIVLVYDKPWWREIGLRGSFISVNGTVSFSYDTSVEADGQYSITCFIVAGTGRKWSILSPIRRRKTVLDEIAALVGDENGHEVYQTEEIIEDEWYGNVLRSPCGNLHFVGTETAYEWKGYMDGAISAGERGAEEVIRALGKSAAT